MVRGCWADEMTDWLIPILRLTEHLGFEVGFRHFVFRPKPDITAYELAQALPWTVANGMSIDHWEALGALKRHFELIEAPLPVPEYTGITG